MTFVDELQHIAAGIDAKVEHKRDSEYVMKAVIAERKAFLSTRKLAYTAKIDVDDEHRDVSFTEMLKESGVGVSSGIDDPTPGFGFKVGTYNTTSGARKGTIAEQSTLFGKKYSYRFDFAKVRESVKAAAESSGYHFSYHVV